MSPLMFFQSLVKLGTIIGFFIIFLIRPDVCYISVGGKSLHSPAHAKNNIKCFKNQHT